jgi:hypothetical protein
MEWKWDGNAVEMKWKWSGNGMEMQLKWSGNGMENGNGMEVEKETET